MGTQGLVQLPMAYALLPLCVVGRARAASVKTSEGGALALPLRTILGRVPRSRHTDHVVVSRRGRHGEEPGPAPGRPLQCGVHPRSRGSSSSHRAGCRRVALRCRYLDRQGRRDLGEVLVELEAQGLPPSTTITWSGALAARPAVRGHHHRDADSPCGCVRSEAELSSRPTRVWPLSARTADHLLFVDKGCASFDAFFHCPSSSRLWGGSLLVAARLGSGCTVGRSRSAVLRPEHDAPVTDELGGRDFCSGRHRAPAMSPNALADGRHKAPLWSIESSTSARPRRRGTDPADLESRWNLFGSVGNLLAPSTGSEVHGEPVKRGPRGNACSGFRSRSSHVIEWDSVPLAVVPPPRRAVLTSDSRLRVRRGSPAESYPTSTRGCSQWRSALNSL